MLLCKMVVQEKEEVVNFENSKLILKANKLLFISFFLNIKSI